MADKRISELTAATNFGANDLLVLEQSNVAKKLTGSLLRQLGTGVDVSLTSTEYNTLAGLLGISTVSMGNPFSSGLMSMGNPLSEIEEMPESEETE